MSLRSMLKLTLKRRILLILTGLKEELDQVMRKNRELAESNRQHMKEYAKLKMQYEKVMSKSTLGSAFVKTGAATTIENSKGGPAQYPQIIHNAGLYPAMNQAGPNRIAVSSLEL